MNRGYTKSWRKRWDKDYCQDLLLFVMMQYFIDHANWRDTEIYFPNVGAIPLKRGDHLFSTRKLSMKLRVHRQRIRTKLKMLENIGFLTRRTTHRYTIISVVNYDIYQSDDERANPPTNQQLTQSKPSTNPPLTIDKKDKNIVSISKKENPPGGLFKKTEKNKMQKIEDLCNQLNEICLGNRNRFNVKQWVMGCISRNVHPDAIIEATESAIANYDTINDLWAWCDKIVEIKSGNYHEADAAKHSEAQKQELSELIKDIGCTE